MPGSITGSRRTRRTTAGCRATRRRTTRPPRRGTGRRCSRSSRRRWTGPRRDLRPAFPARGRLTNVHGRGMGMVNPEMESADRGGDAAGAAASRRPRVICHMLASVDGRIVVDRWPITPEGRREYERVHAGYEPDGWICGRVTMEPFAGGMRPDAEVAREHADAAPREDFRAPGDHDSFAFAIDASGRLAWETNDVDGDHVVAILSERVSDEYLAFLRERGVSYLLAGAREPSAGSGPAVDLALALEKIGARFPVRTL